MSFLDVFHAKNEQETIGLDDVLLRAVLKNDEIDREKAMMIPAVAACVDRISNAFAMIPFKLYERTVEDDEVKIRPVDDDRVNVLNVETGDTLDGFSMKKAVCEDYLLGKGGFCYIDKRGNTVKALRYVKEESVEFLTNSDPIFREYEVCVNAMRYHPFHFIKLVRSSRDGIRGESILDQVRDALATAYATLRFQYNQMAKGGNRKGFLQAENKIGKDEVEALRKAWANMYSNNSDNIPVLNKGVTFKESSNSSVELQLNQSKITLMREIDDIFHVSDDYATFIKEAVAPICAAFATELNRVFLLDSEKDRYFWEADYSEILKADIKERYEAYKSAKEAGWITVNEIRKRENLPRIDGMDVVNVGLSAALYDIETGKYFVPNTGELKIIDPEENEEEGSTDESSAAPAEGHEEDSRTNGNNDDDDPSRESQVDEDRSK